VAADLLSLESSSEISARITGRNEGQHRPSAKLLV
jgi:hypothetical protein